MKMTMQDRVHALMRSSKYQNDYDRYFSAAEKGGYIDGHIAGEYIFTLSPPAKKLCRKYKIPYPVIPLARLEFSPPLAPKEKISAIAFAPAVVMLKDGKQLGPEEDGYMTIRINLACSLSDLQEAVKQLYKTIKHYTPKAPRLKEASIDIWDVYDLKKSGLNSSQIAKKLSGNSDNPSHNKIVMSWYKKVVLAFKRAESIVAAVEV